MACEGELSLIRRSSSRFAVLGVIDSKYDDLSEELSPMEMASRLTWYKHTRIRRREYSCRSFLPFHKRSRQSNLRCE